MSAAAAASPAATGYNRMAIVAVVSAVVAVVGFLGTFTVLAVFAVGAGHVALNQINRDGGQGRQLARASLAVGYAIGIFGLLFTVLTVLGGFYN
ncbi:DUF4190 domain-containing protein (plasmid) [Arthrobacter sp. G.S.26]|uniref:DUF4190 domain-containing protein n=1 Tax=Arthrobacter sp. G.S.26 TaxID=3433706 RepID=UPI003D778CD6